MNKPHWECLHDWALEDVRFELEQIWELKKLLRKHPADKMGEIFRDMIKMCKKCLAAAVKSYEKVYGDKPDVVAIRRKVEGGS